MGKFQHASFSVLLQGTEYNPIIWRLSTSWLPRPKYSDYSEVPDDLDLSQMTLDEGIHSRCDDGSEPLSVSDRHYLAFWLLYLRISSFAGTSRISG